MKQYNLIIPMGGSGKRFAKSGYIEYKPFIEILGKRMIEYIIELFPKSVNILLPVNKTLFTKEHQKLLESHENIKIVPIEHHELGPVYTLSRILEFIKDNDGYFVSYNDIAWQWDFQKEIDFIEKDTCSGVVYTHERFHPHLVQNNYSAFCRCDNDALLEIKEKGSFTDDWMSEPLSVGFFYFSKGSDLKEYTNKLMADDIRVSNEYFPSLLFNYYVKDGKAVKTREVEWFIHWGIPEQLEDFLHWRGVFNQKNKSHNYKTIIMMGGTGSRMKIFGKGNKAFLPVCGKEMFEFVKEMHNSSDNSLIVNDETLKSLEDIGKSYDYFNIGAQTSSQMETIEKSLTYLSKLDKFFMLSNDCYGIFNLSKIEENLDANFLIFGFKPTLTQAKMGKHHTYFSHSNGKVTSVHVKSKSTDADIGLAGMFFVPKGAILNELSKVVQDKHDMSFDYFAKYLVDGGFDVRYILLDRYVHLGTPDEYQEFLYWERYFNK